MDHFLEIAEDINRRISLILLAALSGSEPKYRTIDNFVRWGLVEEDMHKATYEALGINVT